MPGGRAELIWEQEAAGSNLAIPTASYRMQCQHLQAGAVCLSDRDRQMGQVKGSKITVPVSRDLFRIL